MPTLSKTTALKKNSKVKKDEIPFDTGDLQHPNIEEGEDVKELTYENYDAKPSAPQADDDKPQGKVIEMFLEKTIQEQEYQPLKVGFRYLLKEGEDEENAFDYMKGMAEYLLNKE